MRDRQVTFGALISYLAIAFNIISGLIYTPWMIRSIGSDQYALYTLALSVINIFLMDFGIGSAVTKFLSNYYARGEYDEANQFMGVVYKVFFIISLVIAACLFAFYFFIDGLYAKLSPEELVVFRQLFIIVATYSVLSFPFTSFNGVLMANERFIEVKLCSLGQKIFNVVAIIILLLSGMGVFALVLTYALSNVVFLLAKYIIIKRKTAQRVVWGSDHDNTLVKKLFGFSIWVTIMSVAQRCIFNIMPSVIAAVIGSNAVTVFSLAATLEGYVNIFADAINGMFLPKVSRILVQENTQERLSGLMTMVGRFHVCTLGLIFIGFLCFGKQFVALWMGDGYGDIYSCALLLIFPSLISVPQQVANTALLAKDIVREQAAIYVGMGLSNLVLSVILLKKIGIVGGAVSICIAYLLKTGAMNFLYRKMLSINLKKYFADVYLRWSVVAVGSILCGMVINRIRFAEGWLGLCINIIIMTTVYGALLFLFSAMGHPKIFLRRDKPIKP